MASQRFNPNAVKLHRAYTVGELADRLGVHKHTVRNWQRDGLQPIDENRPVLFQGATVRDFLRSRNASRKSPCGPGTMYCFRCRAPRPPALDMVDYTPSNAVSGNLKAICGTCDTIMHRRARHALLPAVFPDFQVQITQG